jgi:hypothetical protein
MHEWQVDIELEDGEKLGNRRPSQLMVVREMEGVLVGRTQLGWAVSLSVLAENEMEAATVGIGRITALSAPLAGRVKQVDVVPLDEGRPAASKETACA